MPGLWVAVDSGPRVPDTLGRARVVALMGKEPSSVALAALRNSRIAIGGLVTLAVWCAQH